MSDEKDKEFVEFQAYWRLSEEMIGKASKDDLAEALRILSMQSAHYTRKFGELALPDLERQHALLEQGWWGVAPGQAPGSLLLRNLLPGP